PYPTSFVSTLSLHDALPIWPFDIANRQVQISGSVGIVVHPDQGRGDKLVANADAAMYAAKRAGGGTYAMFEPHMDIGALEELNLDRKSTRLNSSHLVISYAV